MTKVLGKTFDLLEYVVMRGRPVLPKELVASLRLSQPTVVRLLKELAALGYLEQAGARQGYLPGPMAYHLGGGLHYQNDFYETAVPMIRECAREIGQAVLFSLRCGSWRYVYHCSNFNPGFYIPLEPIRLPDLYRTCGGRVLLAYAEEREREEVLAELGPASPTPKSMNHWPEALGDLHDLRRELTRIRTQGREVMPLSHGGGHLYCLALPVFRDGKFMGAISGNWPSGSDEAFNRRCDEAVTNLVERLSSRRASRRVIG